MAPERSAWEDRETAAKGLPYARNLIPGNYLIVPRLAKFVNRIKIQRYKRNQFNVL